MQKKSTKENRTQIILFEDHKTFDLVLKSLLIFIMLIALLITATDLIRHEVTKDSSMYKNCLDACSKKHFSGIQLGEDDIGNDHQKITNPIVQEFDRTECIKSCYSIIDKRGTE